MISFAPTYLATVRAETLRLKKGSYLLRNDGLLERLEHGFAFGECEAHGGGRQVLPLHSGDLPGFCLAFIGGDHHVNRVLHGHVPSW
jgi:hypothetical protein